MRTSTLIVILVIHALFHRISLAQHSFDGLAAAAATDKTLSSKLKQWEQLTQIRNWKDKSGEHTLVARFQGPGPKLESIALARPDGSPITVLLTNLSDKDRELAWRLILLERDLNGNLIVLLKSSQSEHADEAENHPASNLQAANNGLGPSKKDLMSPIGSQRRGAKVLEFPPNDSYTAILKNPQEHVGKVYQWNMLTDISFTRAVDNPSHFVVGGWVINETKELLPAFGNFKLVIPPELIASINSATNGDTKGVFYSLAFDIQRHPTLDNHYLGRVYRAQMVSFSEDDIIAGRPRVNVKIPDVDWQIKF